MDGERRKKEKATDCSRKGGIKTQGWEAIRCRECVGFKTRDKEMEKER